MNHESQQPPTQRIEDGGNHRRHAEQGFVITLELLLISTVLILAVLVALTALRNALVQSGIYLGPVLMYDAAAPDSQLLGKVSDFDSSQTPRILRRDPNNGLPIALGVRRDRWTTQSPVFYSSEDCTGSPYVHIPDSFAVPDLEVGQRFDHFGEIQGVVYAVGVGGGILAGSPFGPGRLLRSDLATPSSITITSVYISGWELRDHSAGPPAASAGPWSSLPLSPCRDLPDAMRAGLVPAIYVDDPATTLNVLERFVPPFFAR